ncbi:hypothetical protein D3C81_1295780 [compost metagenome]
MNPNAVKWDIGDHGVKVHVSPIDGFKSLNMDGSSWIKLSGNATSKRIQLNPVKLRFIPSRWENGKEISGAHGRFEQATPGSIL